METIHELDVAPLHMVSAVLANKGGGNPTAPQIRFRNTSRKRLVLTYVRAVQSTVEADTPFALEVLRSAQGGTLGDGATPYATAVVEMPAYSGGLSPVEIGIFLAGGGTPPAPPGSFEVARLETNLAPMHLEDLGIWLAADEYLFFRHNAADTLLLSVGLKPMRT